MLKVRLLGGKFPHLLTQLFFKADPNQKNDRFVKSSLIIDLQIITNSNGSYKEGVFDIVLESN